MMKFGMKYLCVVHIASWYLHWCVQTEQRISYCFGNVKVWRMNIPPILPYKLQAKVNAYEKWWQFQTQNTLMQCLCLKANINLASYCVLFFQKA